MSLDVQTIKKLKEETGAGILDVKNALADNAGDYEKSKETLMKKGLAKAASKSDRVTKDGLVYSYIHTGGKTGTLVMVACETDFVAKTEDFKNLCHNVAMQVATQEYENVDELLDAEYIKDESKKIRDILQETIAKLGENIEISDFVRFSVR